MATAEFAVAIPALVATLVLAVAGVATGVDQVRCVDAARLAARAVARGDPPAVAAELAATAAPVGAAVAIGGSGEQVVVTVRSRRAVPGWASGWSVSATAIAPRERSPTAVEMGLGR